MEMAADFNIDEVLAAHGARRKQRHLQPFTKLNCIPYPAFSFPTLRTPHQLDSEIDDIGRPLKATALTGVARFLSDAIGYRENIR
ncbi:MAG TPA: hypothetical protein DCY26_14670 [Hyphomonas sp.]|nr:hypothetical protein [Hyphomonas sp.]